MWTVLGLFILWILSMYFYMPLPIVVVLFLRAFAPGAAEFYATVGGELLLLGCALAMGAGYWWMRRMGSVPRARRLETRA